MRTLSLLTLAAGAALVPTAALAQGAPRAGVHVQGPNVQMRHPGMRPGPGFRPGRHFRPGPGFRPGHGFQRRLHRGFVIPPFFFGPQFHVQNWQLYGFAQPGADQRWVRYYDDAYLIDRGGRIVDAREGLDWDEYGERWELEDGIPSYYGRNEYQPGEGDYEWVEEHRGREGHGDRRHHEEGGWDYSGYGHPGAGGHGYAYGQAMAPGVTVYGGGYGYGYYAYPIIIETTTSASSSYVVEEVIEEVVETRRPRVRRARCNCPPPRRRAPRPAPRPRPTAGERG